jgi:hypothetical protein
MLVHALLQLGFLRVGVVGVTGDELRLQAVREVGLALRCVGVGLRDRFNTLDGKVGALLGNGLARIELGSASLVGLGDLGLRRCFGLGRVVGAELVELCVVRRIRRAARCDC